MLLFTDSTSESFKIDGNNDAKPSVKKVTQAELNSQVDLSNITSEILPYFRC